MATRRNGETVAEFHGLSDRDLPLALGPTESPALNNVELGDGVISQRFGYTRKNTTSFRDAAARLDGVDNYFCIPHHANYNPGAGEEFFISIDVTLRGRAPFDSASATAGDRTLISKGFGATTNLEYRLFYDVSLNTNLGGWTFEAWDTDGGGSLKTWSVSDGDGDNFPEGEYRHIEFGWFGSAADYELRVYDFDATLIGSDTTATLVSDNFMTGSIYVGVGQTALNTADTDFIFATVAELRLCVFNSTTFSTGCPISHSVVTALGFPTVVGRELNVGHSEQLTTFLKGYWKFSDGRGINVADEVSTANGALAPNAGPKWVTDNTAVVGEAGLQWVGMVGFIHWQVTTANMGDVFAPTVGQPILNFLINYIPEVEVGETTVRDGILIWMGTNSTNPSPIGVRVVSDAIQIDWHDGLVLRSTTKVGWTQSHATGFPYASTMSLFELKDLSLAVSFHYITGGAGPTHALQCLVYIDDPSNQPNGHFYYYQTLTLGTVATTSLSDDWFIGRIVKTPTFPYSLSGAAPFGIISQVMFGKGGFITGPAAFGGPSGQFWQFSPQTVGLLPLNQGSGTTLITHGRETSNAYIFPADRTGLRWDGGIVIPYRAPVGRAIYDYRRFAQGDATPVKRSVIVVTGCTIHDVDMSDGSYVVVDGGLEKSGLVTVDQYEGVVYLAAGNSQRPIRIDGNRATDVGIDPPGPAVASVLTPAGGSIAAGTLQVYVTFVNENTGEESNPSPAVAVTFVLNDKISTANLPISPDPQVNARYVYVTAIGGADGSVAYLSKKIHDNTQSTTVSLEILSVDTTQPNLEYFDNGAAPQGSLVQVFNDRLYVSGNQDKPSRVYFSKSGLPHTFDTVDDFIDTNSDEGDPVVALEPRVDVVTAGTRDGRHDLWPTGIVADPVDHRPTNRSSGVVGPLAILEHSRQQVFVSEREIFITDGYNDQSLSSPPRATTNLLGNKSTPAPSIQYFLRNELNETLRHRASIAFHRTRSQLYFSLADSTATARNNIILVYDIQRKIWSKFDVLAELVAEVEDATDASFVFAIIEGFLCQLDTDTDDGVGTAPLLTANGGTTLTVNLDGDALSGTTVRGLRMYILHTDNTVEAVIVSDSVYFSGIDTTIVYLYSALGTTAANLEGVAFGAYGMFFDLMIGTRSPARTKRLTEIKVVLSASASTNVKVALAPNDDRRTPLFTTRLDRVIPLTSTSRKESFRGAFKAENWRMRVSQTAFPSTTLAAASQPLNGIPGPGKIDFFAFKYVWVDTDVR